ncbi:MAG TPA: glycosyltransferase family 39 protein [Vicinamibacterales bacterium]|nr:glycosyltransferase family 39 protein [Vicinamibacterales bacterium]
MPSLRSRLIDSISLIAIVASAILAFIAVFGSGVYTSAYGIRLSSQTLWRPAIVAVVASAFLLYRSELRQQTLTRIASQILQHATAVAIALAAVTVVMAFRVSAFEVVGADVYGYVSQAHLWVSGALVQHEPLSLRAPWPETEWTFSPLGYRPGLERGTIVPTYPPGLPLLMGGMLVLFGRDGPFFVVPLLGGVAIVTAFLLGRRVGGEACGLATAALLLTSPVFLFHLKEPMSDVPVTAWWLLAILLASRTTPASTIAAGFATSAALLTRPNLVPLALLLGIFVLFYSAERRRRGLLNACMFAAGVVPGCIGVAVVNARLYGSPLSSGYGDMSVLFSVEYFWTNLSQYSRWLLDMETPFIVLAAVGWFLLRRREGHQRRFSNLFVAFAAVLYGCYASYIPFDNWTFLRFLLPAIALCLLLCAVAVSYVGERLNSFPSKFLLVACFVVFLAWRWDVAGFKPVRPHDRRFAVIGQYVHEQLPRNAIVFSILHSGSIRYYSGRLTFRWDWLPPEWLDRSLVFLTSNGYKPFLLMEDVERAQFVQRFSGQSRIGALRFTPVATYYGSTRADLYDLENPTRQTESETIRSRVP